MEKVKVLFISADPYDFKLLKEEVGERADIVLAESLSRAGKIFRETDIDLVAMSPAMFRNLWTHRERQREER